MQSRSERLAIDAASGTMDHDSYVTWIHIGDGIRNQEQEYDDPGTDAQQPHESRPSVPRGAAETHRFEAITNPGPANHGQSPCSNRGTAIPRWRGMRPSSARTSIHSETAASDGTS